MHKKVASGPQDKGVPMQLAAAAAVHMMLHPASGGSLCDNTLSPGPSMCALTHLTHDLNHTEKGKVAYQLECCSLKMQQQQ